MSVRKKTQQTLGLTAPIKQEDTLEHERLGNNSYLLYFNVNCKLQCRLSSFKHGFFLYNSSRPWIFNCISSLRKLLTRKCWKVISLEEKICTSWKINLGKLGYERSIPVVAEALKFFSCSKTKNSTSQTINLQHNRLLGITGACSQSGLPGHPGFKPDFTLPSNVPALPAVEKELLETLKNCFFLWGSILLLQIIVVGQCVYKLRLCSF